MKHDVSAILMGLCHPKVSYVFTSSRYNIPLIHLIRDGVKRHRLAVDEVPYRFLSRRDMEVSSPRAII